MFSGIKRLSTVPSGSAAKAASVVGSGFVHHGVAFAMAVIMITASAGRSARGLCD